MLKDQADNNDTVNNNQESNDEEQYQRLFKKIARDFVCRADLEASLNKMLERIERGEQPFNELEEDTTYNGTLGAIMKALEYRANLARPKHKRVKYRDVIENDE